MEVSDDPEAIASVKDGVDKVLKLFHDCQHSTRGFIKSQAPAEELNWFISAVQQALDTMKLCHLESTDEFIDLASDLSIASKFRTDVVSLDLLPTADHQGDDADSVMISESQEVSK